MARNPFRPSFGTTPPLLAGRDEALAAFADALEGGNGSPGRATLYTGPRGVGKTVLLNAVEDLARAHGWLVVSETASPGFVDRLVTEGLPTAARLLDLPTEERRITGVSLPMHLGGVETEVEEVNRPAPGLRTQLSTLTDQLAGHRTGILLTLDEIHAAARGPAREDLRTLGAVVQHCFREERPVALVAAGLPTAVHDVLNDDVLTFLRRAERHHLGAVDPADVAEALSRPITDAGRAITDEALADAVAGTEGYPFLIQLIGHWVWRRSDDAATITAEHARQGLEAARLRMGTLVHEPALMDLSTVDRRFLAAMARDEGRSAMSDVAQRLGKDANYVSQYRLRLLAAGLVKPAGHGYVDVAVPYLRDYLREHAERLGL